MFATPAPLPVAHLDDQERIACIRLIRSHNVGPTTFRDLINHYGGAHQALEALPHIAQRRAGSKKFKICSQMEAEDELAAAMQANAKPLFTIEPGYPARLANLPVPPPMLYVSGNQDLLQQPAIAIIGARLASAAGTKLANQFASKLGQAGLVIVSGLARGIDGAAHKAAIDTGTIAVVAGGVDVVYPPEHEELHHQIANFGCIVSEMPCGFKPRAKDFPRRNRLISGTSISVLIVEAALRSGSLVTARYAAEQGREVFAIPGHPLDPRAKGTNALLKDGATIATEPNDIIAMLTPLTGSTSHTFREPQRPHITPQQAPTKSKLPDRQTPTTSHEPIKHSHSTTRRDTTQHAPNHDALNPEKTSTTGDAHDNENNTEVVRTVLGTAPIDIDSILRATGLAANQVRIALIELELSDEIERHGANLVSLKASGGQNID